MNYTYSIIFKIEFSTSSLISYHLTHKICKPVKNKSTIGDRMMQWSYVFMSNRPASTLVKFGKVNYTLYDIHVPIYNKLCTNTFTTM